MARWGSGPRCGIEMWSEHEKRTCRDNPGVTCGVILAMLTKLWSVDRSGSLLVELAQKLADTGRRSVAVASDSFGARQGGGGG